jgi:hypothetical protein
VGRDYNVLAEGIVVGRIMKAADSPVGTPWLWSWAKGHHEDRTPIYGYEPTRGQRSLSPGGGNRAAPPLAWPRWSQPLVIFALLMFPVIARGFRNETWFYALLTVLAAIIGVAIALYLSFLHVITR